MTDAELAQVDDGTKILAVAAIWIYQHMAADARATPPLWACDDITPQETTA